MQLNAILNSGFIWIDFGLKVKLYKSLCQTRFVKGIWFHSFIPNSRLVWIDFSLKNKILQSQSLFAKIDWCLQLNAIPTLGSFG